MIKHYVELLYPGFLFRVHTEEKEVEEREVCFVVIPQGCVGFRFFDREEETDEKKNISGWYYLGQKLTLKQLKEKYGDKVQYQNVIFNMEKNNMEAVVKTPSDNFYELKPEDSVLIVK